MREMIFIVGVMAVWMWLVVRLCRNSPNRRRRRKPNGKRKG